MYERLQLGQDEALLTASFVLDRSFALPSNLQIDGDRVIYDLVHDGTPDELQGDRSGAKSENDSDALLLGLRNLEHASNAEVFEFVQRRGPLGIWGEFLPIGDGQSEQQVAEKIESYRYSARLIRQLYSLATSVCENGAAELDAWRELDETMSGGPIAEFGVRERIGHSFEQHLQVSSSASVNAFLLKNVMNAIVSCRSSLDFHDGKLYPKLTPELTIYWDRRYCDESGQRNTLPSWSFLPMALLELATALSEPSSICLYCEQPYFLGQDRQPRKNRCCSEHCRNELDKARKRKYWHAKGKNLPSQQEK